MTLRSLCFALLAAAFSTSTLAAEFAVSPIRVQLTPKQRSAAVTVTNQADQPLSLLIRGTEWAQDADGHDTYTPTDGVMHAPTVLRLEKGEQRAVRIGVPAPASEVERTYRVWLEEQPESTAQARALVNVAIRFGVPVFLPPAQPRTAGEVVGLARDGDTLQLTVRNSGNIHFRIEDIEIDGTKAVDIPSWYLLAGAARQYRAPWRAEWCARGGAQVAVRTSRFEQPLPNLTASLAPLCEGR